MNPNRECPHCIWTTAQGLFHSKVCRCGCHHADHVLFGGCLTKGCFCDRYDQSLEARMPKSTPETLSKVADIIDVAKLEAEVLDNNPDTLGKVQTRVDELKKKVAAI